MKNIKLISLGGVGGCYIRDILRKLDNPTYIYDSLVTNHIFVQESLTDKTKFFDFNNHQKVHNGCYFLDENKNAVMLHQFGNFSIQQKEVIDKYERRYKRLEDTLNSEYHILFIRQMDNINVKLETFYDNIFIRTSENIDQWTEFILNLRKIYTNSNIHFLLLSNDIIETSNNGIYTRKGNREQFNDIIKEVIEKVNENIKIHFNI